MVSFLALAAFDDFKQSSSACICLGIERMSLSGPERERAAITWSSSSLQGGMPFVVLRVATRRSLKVIVLRARARVGWVRWSILRELFAMVRSQKENQNDSPH